MPQPTKGPRLGGSPAHEKLMLANLPHRCSGTKITTTETKAKRLRPLAERLVTFAKRGDLHSRRRVLTTIRDKDVVYTLFDQIGPRFETRPGGYTRITRRASVRVTRLRWPSCEPGEELVVATPTPAKTAKATARKSARTDAVAALAGETDEDATPARKAADADAKSDDDA